MEVRRAEWSRRLHDDVPWRRENCSAPYRAMRLRSLFLAIAILAPRLSIAQSSSADGVQALIRGDYATAQRILQPLAETTSQPDPVAQFFLATMYESGLGVRMDLIRACGLYLKAARVDGPFASQSLALADTITPDNPVLRKLCADAGAENWNEPEPASFTLAPDYWVRVDRLGLTVGYQGAQKTATRTLGGPGWVNLPIRYSYADVTRPTETRRHFVELFMWVPSRELGQPTWRLAWFIYEVVGVEAFEVALGPSVIIESDQQPSPNVAIDNIARIRVNANGEAEQVIGGDNPRTSVIPSGGIR